MDRASSQSIAELKKSVAEFRASNGGRRTRFPERIRRQAIALLREGASIYSVAKSVDLDASLLLAWNGTVQKLAQKSRKAAPRAQVASQVFAIEERAYGVAREGGELQLRLGRFAITVHVEQEGV